MASAPEPVPPVAPRAPRAGATNLLTFVCLACISLWASYTYNVMYNCYQDDVRQVREMVRGRRAKLPVQHTRLLFDAICDRAQERLGVDPSFPDRALVALGYLALLLAGWYWLAGLGVGLPGVLASSLASVGYGMFAFKYSWEQPVDVYGAACAALAFGAAVRGRTPGVLAVSLASGFLWQKHVLVAPALLVFYRLRGRGWGWSLGLAAAVFGLARVGPAVYEAMIGYQPVNPAGILPRRVFLPLLPRSLALQFVMAFPPIWLLCRAGRAVPASIRSAFLIYPPIVLLYAQRSYAMHEPRSFWIVVPVFTAMIGWYVETHGGARPVSAGETPAGEAPAGAPAVAAG